MGGSPARWGCLFPTCWGCLGCGARAAMARQVVTPQHPGDGQSALSLGCSAVPDTPPLSLFPQQPWGLAATLPCPWVWGQGTSASRVAGGQLLRAIVAQGGGLKGRLFCLSLGCWGCWYFGSLNSSDLGGSRPWQALNSYCSLSSPVEWEAGWRLGAGGTHSIPTLLPGDRQMPHAAAGLG